jgi:hypothetical protein
MSMAPITAQHIRHATETLAHSARPDTPIRPEPVAGPRWWRRFGGGLRLPLAVRRSPGSPAPAVK